MRRADVAQETFAPTVKVAAIRIILALAAHFDWDVEQMDVVTAFLEADIAEDIYMRQPEGYRQVDQHGEELVCKVLKSIYGLKQAPRNWNKTVSAWLVEYGFKQGRLWPGTVHLYLRCWWRQDLYILALYVDDSIMAGPPGSFISDFKRAFGKRFNVLGPVSWLVGMTVERDRAAGVLKVGQRQLILDKLERFNMSDCKAVSTPMTVGALSEATASEVLSPDVPYQSLIWRAPRRDDRVARNGGRCAEVVPTPSRCPGFTVRNCYLWFSAWHFIEQLPSGIVGSIDINTAIHIYGTRTDKCGIVRLQTSWQLFGEAGRVRLSRYHHGFRGYSCGTTFRMDRH